MKNTHNISAKPVNGHHLSKKGDIIGYWHNQPIRIGYVHPMDERKTPK